MIDDEVLKDAYRAVALIRIGGWIRFRAKPHDGGW
jgi:hypothetical protein